MKLKDKIVKNRLVLLVTIGILLVVTILVGISYAYFFKIHIYLIQMVQVHYQLL